MKTNREQILNQAVGKRGKKRSQSGNALIYVLIAIALFAALGFTLMRQTDSNEMSALDNDRAELLATQLITYTAQAKSAVDQMLFQGGQIDDLNFTLPGAAGFEAPPNYNKVFHPDGGGLINNALNPEVIHQVSSSPPAGWYMGRFNNVQWTKSTGEDVILTAYQIRPEICRIINQKVTGSTDIPVLSGNMSDFLIDRPSSSDFNNANCSTCNNNFSLCVSNSHRTAYSFYTIIADQ